MYVTCSIWRLGIAGCVMGLAAAASDFAPGNSMKELPDKTNFHLYLLMGQSNMAGRGPLDDLSRQEHPRVLMFTEDRRWVPAREPLHRDKPTAGAGLGLTFAITMAEATPGATIGLIPCAVGGTPLARWEKGGDLYARAVEQARAAMPYGTLKGLLWHQGENDTGDRTSAETYANRCSRMIADIRAELGIPDLPVVAGELGRFLPESHEGKPVFWRLVNEQIHMLPDRVSRLAVVSSEGLTPLEDGIHFDTPSLREFGRRYAAAMLRLQRDAAASAETVTGIPPSAGGTP